jgi:hypothetical protein
MPPARRGQAARGQNGRGEATLARARWAPAGKGGASRIATTQAAIASLEIN